MASLEARQAAIRTAAEIFPRDRSSEGDHMTKFLADEYERLGKAPSGDPLDRLRHVVRTYEDSDAGDKVITATTNFYADQFWTGLTHGDLRTLYHRLISAEAFLDPASTRTDAHAREDALRALRDGALALPRTDQPKEDR